MTDTLYYVLYVPQHKCYLDENRVLVPYSAAERFSYPSPAILDNAKGVWNDTQWVGPCKEGEEP